MSKSGSRASFLFLHTYGAVLIKRQRLSPSSWTWNCDLHWTTGWNRWTFVGFWPHALRGLKASESPPKVSCPVRKPTTLRSPFHDETQSNHKKRPYGRVLSFQMCEWIFMELLTQTIYRWISLNERPHPERSTQLSQVIHRIMRNTYVIILNH